MEKNINVTRSFMPAYEEYCEEIRDLWDSCWLTNVGTKHKQLESELTRYLDVDGLELITNGHNALELALQALRLRGEVITTPFTFASTTQAIVRSGLTPVFCDIDPVTLTLDVEKAEALITQNTCAILPVHVYGVVCNVEKLGSLAKTYGLKVIYDAAHAFGVRYQGKGIGSCGDAAIFSFHATKVFHTVEGGGVCFHDMALKKRLTKLRNFGLDGTEPVDELGTNGKMDELRAAMGLCNLRYIDQEIAKRAIVVARYRERLTGTAGLQLSPIQHNVQPNYAYFPVLFDETRFGADREEVSAALAAQGIMARSYFYPLTSSFPCYVGRCVTGDTPVANAASQRVLTLPLYGDLSLEDVDRICNIILRCQRTGEIR